MTGAGNGKKDHDYVSVKHAADKKATWTESLFIKKKKK